jgi:hypothetical protein
MQNLFYLLQIYYLYMIINFIKKFIIFHFTFIMILLINMKIKYKFVFYKPIFQILPYF